MQIATIAEKLGKQAISGRFWAGRTYRGRIKDDHKSEPADGYGRLLCCSYFFFRMRYSFRSINPFRSQSSSSAILFC